MRPLALLLPLGLLLAPATAEARGPRILATGDSMIQIVDVKLEQKLERIQPVSFRSDARVGSGISKGDWVGIARRQARRHRPRATVVFIGANDGFNIGRARCCRGEWVERYGRRVRRMIRAYSLRGKAAGLGEVYWLTLPAPRPAHWRPVYRAVDRAIRRAVKASGPHAHLIDAWKVFTPRGRFRRSMRWRGRRVVVRQDDGVHLSWAGASIAAGLVRDAMRKDAVVG